MTSAYSINLNFNNTIPVKTDFTFKQGDKGITLNLATTGLDPTGTTAHIVFKRSNGTSVEAELTGETGPSYSYTILGNEFEIPGVVVADLKLYDGDTQRVSTASFIFLVTGDTMDGVGGGTGGYSDQLEQLSQEFEDTLTQYEEAFADVGAVHAAGNYDPTTEYSPLDLVYYSTDNSTYLCVEGCTGETPSPSSQYWQLVVDGSAMSTPNLGDLNDVDTTGASSGDLLGFDGADWAPVDFPDADDIDYDNTSSGLTATKVRAAIDEVKGLIPIIPAIPEKTSDLSDVASTAPTNGQILKYNGTSQKYEPAAEAGAGSNQNILINGWFTVNQRGSASYTAAGYTVDRWRTDSDVTITVSAADGVLIGGSYLKQILESSVSDALLGEKVTISIKYADGTISTGTATIPSTYGAAYTSVCSTADNIGFLQVDQSTDKFRVIIASSAKYVRAVKLEIGSVSTIARDTAPDYTTELLKCQRYYFRVTANSNSAPFAWATMVSTNTASVMYKLPVPMRTNTVTVTYSGSLDVYEYPGLAHAYVSSLGKVYRTQTEFVFEFTVSGTPFTTGRSGVVGLVSAGDYFDISAEL